MDRVDLRDKNPMFTRIVQILGGNNMVLAGLIKFQPMAKIVPDFKQVPHPR